MDSYTKHDKILLVRFYSFWTSKEIQKNPHTNIYIQIMNYFIGYMKLQNF